MGNESYYSQIPKIVTPLLSTLLQGKTLNSGNIGLGGIGGTLASFANPKLAPFGSYLGGAAGTALQGGTLGQSLVGGLPNLGLSFLSQLLPNEFQPGAQAMTPVLGGIASSILSPISTAAGTTAAGWGALGTGTSNALNSLGVVGNVLSPILSYAGPIGMVLSSILNIIGDVGAWNDEKAALREIEGSVVGAYGKNASQVDNLYKQLSQYIPEANRNQQWNQQMGSLPEWAQPLLKGGQGLENEGYFSHNPLMLFTSPLMNTFSDPQLTQQLISGLFGGLQNPNQVNFSQWESLTPEQKMQVYRQITGGPEGEFTGMRTRIPSTDEPGRPISAKEWSQLSKTMGSQTPLDPYQIFGGMYKQLYDLEQANNSLLGQKPTGSEFLGASTYVQPQQSMQSPTNSSLVEGSQLPQSTTAGSLFNSLLQGGFYKDILGDPYGFWKNGSNLSEYLDPLSNTAKYLPTGTNVTNPSLNTYLGNNSALSLLGTNQQSAFTPGALQAVYNSGWGLPDVETYENTPAAMDQIMHALNLLPGSQFVR